MMKTKAVYVITTGLVCAVMAYSAINFNLNQPLGPMKGGFRHLGLPSYFRIELSIAKIVGVLAILIPGVPIKVKEFTYFGFAVTLISASIAHFSVGDPLLFVIDPLFFFAALVTSYNYFLKFNRKRQELRSEEWALFSHTGELGKQAL